jgi:hypothetical protein
MSESDAGSRRRHRRRKTLLPGLVASSNGSAVAEILVHDLSESGAKLVVPSGQSIPQRSYLIINGRSCALEVVIVRTLANGFGVRFVEMHTLNNLRGPRWELLRRLIAQRLPGAGTLT